MYNPNSISDTFFWLSWGTALYIYTIVTVSRDWNGAPFWPLVALYRHTSVVHIDTCWEKKETHTKSKIVQCLVMWGMDFNVLFSYQTFVVLVVVSIFCLSRNYNRRDLNKRRIEKARKIYIKVKLYKDWEVYI